jgi:hypothetical protein
MAVNGTGEAETALEETTPADKLAAYLLSQVDAELS